MEVNQLEKVIQVQGNNAKHKLAVSIVILSHFLCKTTYKDHFVLFLFSLEDLGVKRIGPLYHISWPKKTDFLDIAQWILEILKSFVQIPLQDKEFMVFFFFFHYEYWTLDRVYVCTGASRETAKNPMAVFTVKNGIKQSTLHTLGQVSLKEGPKSALQGM